jgi:threonine/homoserine/homoserine lactone efflux protein
MFGVLAVDFFLLSRGRWDLSEHARSRWLMLLPWAAGFITYQLINPGYISWWVAVWSRFGRTIGFRPESWMSASICSFVVAGVLTLIGGGLALAVRRGRDRGRRDTLAVEGVLK